MRAELLGSVPALATLSWPVAWLSSVWRFLKVCVWGALGGQAAGPVGIYLAQRMGAVVLASRGASVVALEDMDMNRGHVLKYQSLVGKVGESYINIYI